MPTTIFFSWQTDTPTKEGRNLIERALNDAITAIATDVSVDTALRTRGSTPTWCVSIQGRGEIWDVQ